MPGIEFAPGPGICGCPGGYGILAFRFQQAESADVAFLLDSENIMVRSGNLCKGRNAEADDFLRISLHVYNSRDEIDRLIEVLQSEL
jgi:cysteine desulfurase/selenocysteine lyase